MSTISLQELTQDADTVLDRIEAGEHFTIMRGGRPVAELTAVSATKLTQRPYGLAAGQFTVPDDFDAPLPEDELMEFEGR
jgi:antitoxin (DNA-binding transcriptional repressor) of toxin-antitoxin stability system